MIPSSEVLGQAQTDRILTPAVTGSAALVEIADLAEAQQGTKARPRRARGKPGKTGENRGETRRN